MESIRTTVLLITSSFWGTNVGQFCFVRATKKAILQKECQFHYKPIVKESSHEIPQIRMPLYRGLIQELL